VARLLAAARGARRHAIADYSGFAVGAALETAEGEIVTGCNIENATFGLTMCAERVALFKALSEGRTAIRRVALVSATTSPTPPCGACRQLLWEFAGDVEIVMGNDAHETARCRLGALLPLPFSRQLLAGGSRPLRRRRKPPNPL
jgi:cytidine deaminase